MPVKWAGGTCGTAANATKLAKTSVVAIRVLQVAFRFVARPYRDTCTTCAAP